MRRPALPLLAALLLTPTMALAQPTPKAGETTGRVDAARAVTKKVTKHTFDPDEVVGGLVRPSELSTVGEQHGKTSSLIDIRADFLPELLTSADTL